MKETLLEILTKALVWVETGETFKWLYNFYYSFNNNFYEISRTKSLSTDKSGRIKRDFP